MTSNDRGGGGGIDPIFDRDVLSSVSMFVYLWDML